MLVSEDIITTILKNEFKIGRHAWDMEIKDFVRMTILLGARATTTIVAIVWTKTAFAITLLRLTEGKVRLVCWFIIVSLSIAMGFSAAVPWISCTPVQKSWDRSVPGTCWGDDNVIKIWVGTGGKHSLLTSPFLFILRTLPCSGSTTPQSVNTNRSYLRRSILGRHGLCPCRPAVDHHHEAQDAEEGEDWRGHCHEHGRRVSIRLPRHHLT